MNKWNLKLQHTTIYICTPQNEYLGVNLIKHIQDQYEENYKILVNKIKELNKWIFMLMDSRRFNIVKTSVLPNLIYRLSATPIKIPASSFVGINKVCTKKQNPE